MISRFDADGCSLYAAQTSRMRLICFCERFMSTANLLNPILRQFRAGVSRPRHGLGDRIRVPPAQRGVSQIFWQHRLAALGTPNDPTPGERSMALVRPTPLAYDGGRYGAHPAKKLRRYVFAH